MSDSHNRANREPNGHNVQSGRYTMAEAARIKGVSYHTVSRAVRSGKLAAQRLGRMALIDAGDLQEWQPMRERAPRKYRREKQDQAAQQQRPALAEVPAANRSSTRLATAIATLHEGAANRTIEGFGDWLASLTASLLSLRHVVVWKLNEQDGQARPYGSVGIRAADEELTLSMLANALMRQLSARDEAHVLDAVMVEQLGAATWLSASTSVVAIPLHQGVRSIGVIIGAPAIDEHPVRDYDLKGAMQFGSQAAIAIEHLELRRKSQRDLVASPALLDELTLQVMAIDRSGILVYVNDEVVRQWGDIVREKYVGRHYAHFVGMFRRERLDGREIRIEDHPLTRALNGEVVQEDPCLVSGYFAVPRVFSQSARPLRDDDGELTGAVMTSRDVTAEMQADGGGKASLAQLAEARRKVDALRALASELSRRENVDRAFEIVARRVAEALEADSSVVLTPTADSHMMVRAGYRTHGESLAPGRVVHRLQVPSSILAMAQGEVLVVSDDDAGPSGRAFLEESGATAAIIIPLLDGDEALGVVDVMYSDSARMRRVDREFATALGRQCGHAVYLRNVVMELESSRRRMLTVLDQLPEAVVILDVPHGNVIAVNRQAIALWGDMVERSGLRGAEITMLDQDGRAIQDERRHPLLRPLHTRKTELGVPLMTTDADGHVIDVLANLSPIIGARGDLRGAVAVLQRREVFKPIDQAKDEFISVVAHEIRNPLTSLRGNLQLLERRLQRIDDPAIEREVERVNGVIEQVDRVGALVGSMLDISRADLGKLMIDPAECDAVELAKSAIRDVEGMAEDRTITLEAPAEAPVVWDRMRVLQILTNLLTNAVRYAPTGEINVVVVKDDEDRVTISVRDHGPGVPPRLRRRLFRLYYRFDEGGETADGMSAQQRGLGIGLYISARLATVHGGTLKVEDAKGGGARFVLTLPTVVSVVNEEE